MWCEIPPGLDLNVQVACLTAHFSQSLKSCENVFESKRFFNQCALSKYVSASALSPSVLRLVCSDENPVIAVYSSLN